MTISVWRSLVFVWSLSFYLGHTKLILWMTDSQQEKMEWASKKILIWKKKKKIGVSKQK